MFKKTLFIMLCLISSRAFALTDQEKLDAIGVAAKKFFQLSDLDKLHAFQYLYLKFREHEEEIQVLKQKIEEIKAKNK